jgi:DNA-binding XRE family transcriptional regulator
MKTKVTYLDPKRVLIETVEGERFIAGFDSEMNYQMEQKLNVPFIDFLASLFDKFYKGNGEVIYGEIFRQLITHNLEPINSFRRDPLQNRIYIGDRIREIREKKGMEIAVLAHRSGIQPNTLKRIEAGKFSVDLDVLSHIASGLGMKLDFVELDNDDNHEKSIPDLRH